VDGRDGTRIESPKREGISREWHDGRRSEVDPETSTRKASLHGEAYIAD
jgi:hypothetical protein